MYTYCIFLRGVNVNGIKIKMVDLKALLISFGYENPKTILATGNIILSFDTPIENLNDFKLDLEAKLSDYFSYQAFLFIRDYESINNLVNAADKLKLPDDYHTYALILDEPDTQSELIDEFNNLSSTENESLSAINADVFWIIKKGNTLLSDFGKKALGKKYFKSKLTSRNMNTIRKIHKQMS